MNSCNSFSWTHLLFQWICPACACAELFSTVCLRTTMQPKSYLLRDPSIRSMSLHFGDKDAMRDKHPARIQEDDKTGRFLCTLHNSSSMTSPSFPTPCTIPAGWQAQVSVPCDKNQAFCMPFYQYLMWASHLTQRADRSRCTTGETELLYFRGKKPHVLLLDHINLQLRYGHV